MSSAGRVRHNSLLYLFLKRALQLQMKRYG